MVPSLRAVIVGTFTLRFSTGLTGTMLAFYLAELHRYGGPEVGAQAFGVIHALFYAAELAFSTVFGVLSDRWGHWRVMQVGPLFGAVAVVITAIPPPVLTFGLTLPVLAFTRVLEGSATAASVPSILGFIAAVTATDELLRGRAVARFEAATLAGLLGGFVAAGPLYSALGPVAFLVNALLYGVSLAIYRYGVDPRLDARPAEPHRLPVERYVRILRSSHVWLLAPTWIAINAALGLYTSQTIFQLVREPNPRFADQLLMGGFEPIQISVGLAVGGLLFFAGLFYWGDRFKSLRRTTIILYGIAGGLVLVASAVGINHSAGLPVVVRILFALGVAAGLFVLAGATPAAIGLLADVTERYPDDRGAIMGLYSVFLGVGQIAGSLIGGTAAELRGLDGILGASVVLLVIAVVPLLPLRRYEHYVGGPATPAILDEDARA